MNSIYRVLRIAAVTVLMASEAAFAAVENDVVQILQLARSGRNSEAIGLYEKQSDQSHFQLDVLRAVAGCYWREGRFEEARQLYREILGRQALGGMEKSGSGGALLAKELPDEKDEPTVVEEKGVQKDVQSPVMVPEVPDSADMNQTDLVDELTALRTVVSELEEDREHSLMAVESRISEITSDAEAVANQHHDLQVLLEEEKARAESVSVVRDALQAQIGELNLLITSMKEELETARNQYGELQNESQQKANVLLDAVSEERRRREAVEADFQRTAESAARRLQVSSSELQAAEKERNELRDRLAVMERETSETVQASQSREAALLGQVESLRAADSVYSLRIKGLEQSLLEIQDQRDEAMGRLTLSELASTNQLSSATQNTMLLALDEIDRLEREFAELNALSSERMADLHVRIDELESRGSSTALLLENTVRERDLEREERQALEARFALQADTLNQAKLQLDEAAAALNRQYDAMREQIQGGVTIRVDDLEMEDDKAVWSAEIEPDVASSIQRLESATQSATAEVLMLRRQLEQDRSAFELAAEDSERLRLELASEAEQLKERLESTIAAHKEEAAHMQSVFAQEISELKTEMVALLKALDARSEAVALLERDLEAERESTMRLLSMVQESEGQLSSRIQELEHRILLPQGERQARDGGEEVLLDASVQTILDMLPSDPAGAMARFEALPATRPLPLFFLKSMGNVYRERHHYKKALQVYEHILERVPGDLYAERKLVMTLFDMGKYDQALERLAGPSGTSVSE